jgi:hypothetical protein
MSDQKSFLLVFLLNYSVKDNFWMKPTMLYNLYPYVGIVNWNFAFDSYLFAKILKVTIKETPSWENSTK